MRTLYKYVYSFNPKDIAQYNDVFHVEEFLVKEEEELLFKLISLTIQTT